VRKRGRGGEDEAAMGERAARRIEYRDIVLGCYADRQQRKPSRECTVFYYETEPFSYQHTGKGRLTYTQPYVHTNP
jgi:hypothetical protein